jgi:hypothetical protein
MTKLLTPQTWYYFKGEVAGDFCSGSEEPADVFEVSATGLLKGCVMGMYDRPLEQMLVAPFYDRDSNLLGCSWEPEIPLPMLLKAANRRLDLTMLVKDVERVIQENDHDYEKWLWLYDKILFWYNHAIVSTVHHHIADPY